MENKQTTLAAVLGAIVILVFFVVASLFVGQKIKEHFSQPTQTPVVDNTAANTTTPSLLDNNQNKNTASNTNKYKAIPSTGPEELVLVLLPAVGAAGFYLRKLTS